MKPLPKKILSIMLMLLLLVTAIGGCTKDAEPTETMAPEATAKPEATATPEPTEELAAYPLEVETLGSGDVMWEEVDTPDGWTMVTNEGGTTLGYTKGSGLEIIQVDGYAFKDLNKNNMLELFEDWRVDYELRAASIVEEISTEQMMGLKMNPFGWGSANVEAVDDTTKALLDLGLRYVRAPRGSAEVFVGWNNLIQEYVEGLDNVCIPTTYVADPLGESDVVSKWPGYLGVAASFDPEVAAEYGRLLSEEWRALGISMKIAPQIDLATEPRWKRADSTFGEDPALAMDMARAMVNAWQSSYDADGNDLGWGVDSVNCQIKHLTGDGAAEGGRESHSLDGAYTVFPGGQFYTQLMPFVACLDLPGKTETVSSAMTNFSVAVDGNGDAIGGERTATSHNAWKINTLWRGVYGFDGYILTDFGVIFKDEAEKTIGNNRASGRAYGVEDMTPAERELGMMEAGIDGFGGEGDSGQPEIDLAMEAYALGVEKLGQEAMDEIMNESTRRTMKTLFNVGVMDNPYLSSEHAATVAKSAENQAAGFAAQVKSVVMLKNSGNVIGSASAEKQTVYIPWKYVAEQQGWGGVTPAYVTPCIDLETVREYFNVVTDKIASTLTGPKGEDGNPTVSPEDIDRASAEEIATCDFALVRIKSPQNGNPTSSYGVDSNDVPEDYVYRPISLQYRPYTADSQYVRLESIGGQIIEKVVQGTYDKETVYEKSNTSYYGQTAIITNESDLDLVLYAASVADKVVVAADVKNTMIFSEFESEVDSIVIAFAGDRAPLIDDAAFLEIISGKVEPSGLLPMQMPKDMETVEKQYEDVPRDMECHIDSEGNTYDFAYGLNWSGVIKDDRTAKYDVAPLVGEDPFK